MARKIYGLHKVGKYWHADFWVGEIHIHRSTRHTDLDSAKERAEQWYTEEQRRAQGLPVNTEITVGDLWDRWWTDPALKQTLSESHRKRVERDFRLHILPAWKDMKSKLVSTENAEALRSEYLSKPSLRNRHNPPLDEDGKPKHVADQQRSISSSNKLLLHAHLVFAWAVEVPKLLTHVPWDVKVLETQEKPKDTLSEDQIRPFLAEVDKTRSLHVRIAVRAELYLPLREKEARVMRWEWFSADLKTFQHGDRKANDAPRFPVPVDMRNLLRKLPGKEDGKPWEKPARGLVLPAKDGLPHRQQITTKTVIRAGKALGLHLTPHSMRHSWGTLMARKTGNAHLIKDGLGHTQLNTAMKYVKLSTRDLESAQVDVFGDLAMGVDLEVESQPAPKKRKNTSSNKRKH